MNVLLGLVLATVPMLSAHGDATEDCVTSFMALERAAILDSPGNVEALVEAFYEPNGAFPLSVQVVYHTNLSNGTDTIISTDPNCPPGKEIWLWVPSPILIFIEPSKLNMYALYTLHYFSDWRPPRVHIFVPDICDKDHNRFNFLNDLTMRVQTYAAAHITGVQGSLGYVLKGCGVNIMTTLLPTTQHNNKQGLQTRSMAMVGIYLAGNIFEILLVLIVGAMFLHSKGHSIAIVSNAQPSYDNYGLFWGCVVLSVVGNVFMTVHSILIFQLNLASGVRELIILGCVLVAQLVFGMSTSLIVAIHYGSKLDLSIPSIFSLPFGILFCNRAKQINKKIVQCLSLWSLLLFLVHVLYRASFVFLALLARPSSVVPTSLMYLFAGFCTVHFLAIIFTSTKMKKREQWKKHIPAIVIDLVQTLVFTFTFATALCFGLVIGAAGALANYGSVQNSPYPTLSTLVTPLALAAFGWTLRKVGAQWLKLCIGPSAPKLVGEQDPLLQCPRNEEEDNSETVGGRGVLCRKFASKAWH